MKTTTKFQMALVLLVLLNGCATKALWDSTKNFNQPAPQPDLHLFFAKQQKDFLVVYDECFGRKGSIRKRAYYLFQNEERKNRRVNFVGTNLMEGLAAVPVFAKTPVLIQPLEFYAVAETNTFSFQLVSSNGFIGSYRLPVYNDGKGKYERAMWAPLTIAADVTMVGAIGAVVGLCEEGTSIKFP